MAIGYGWTECTVTVDYLVSLSRYGAILVTSYEFFIAHLLVKPFSG